MSTFHSMMTLIVGDNESGEGFLFAVGVCLGARRYVEMVCGGVEVVD